MKYKLGVPFGIIMQAGQHQERQGVTWGKPQGDSWVGDRIKGMGMGLAISFWILDPANVEWWLDSTTFCPLISICLLTCLLLLTAKNRSHQLPGRKVQEASFFSCIFQLGVWRKEPIATIYFYFLSDRGEQWFFSHFLPVLTSKEREVYQFSLTV